MKTLEKYAGSTYLSMLTFLLLMVVASCSDDDDTETDEEQVDTETDSVIVEDPYLLIPDTDADGGVYLIDQEGNELLEWDIDLALGNDVNLLEDGSLLVALKPEGSQITLGGYGGIFRKINADQTTAWEVSYHSGDEYTAHHDVEYLSNGNIIFPVWEKLTATTAIEELGFAGDNDLYVEAIIEMNPLTDEIVWEWHSIDHLIQDHDDTKANFGEIATNPNKIDFNYNQGQANGDIMHMNGLTVDEGNDLIYVTVNAYSEVWVIDHSTSTTEAASDQGGNYNLGGDLIYRFGNPVAYDNTGTVTLNHCHYPNLMDTGTMLVYANDVYPEQSEVLEFDLNPPYQLVAGQDNEPDVVWSFTDPDLYTGGLGGAVRLGNGNTLIAESREGTLWEVDTNGDVVWKFESTYSSIWRAYAFYPDDSAIVALGL